MNIGQQYSLAWQFIRTDLRRFYKISIIVFLILFCYLSYYLHYGVSLESIEGFLDSHTFQMKAAVNDVVRPDLEISWYGMFVQNLMIAVIAMCVGLIPVIYLPMGAVMIYGIGAGVMVAYTSKVCSLGTMTVITSCFLPHGVIEFICNLLACTCGMYLCTVSTRQLRGCNGEGVWEQATRKILRVFLCIIVPGLLVSSILESTVTMILVQGVTGH